MARKNVPASDVPPNDDALAADEAFGRWLFAQECRFIAGAAGIDGMPPADLPEVAFAGRSNVGKSSLINALTGRRLLARTSNTPGRTRQLNFFRLGDRLTLVDLPGFGYARASKTQIEAWTALTRDYLRGRPTLRRCSLLVDARHGPKDIDDQMMKLLDECGVAYQIVLTKCDKAAGVEVEQQVAACEALARSRPAAVPKVVATSARAGKGISELRAILAELAGPSAMS